MVALQKPLVYFSKGHLDLTLCIPVRVAPAPKREILALSRVRVYGCALGLLVVFSSSKLINRSGIL